MSCWNILGINPTRNVNEIEMAYSKLIKLSTFNNTNEQSNKLTKAYKKALSLAKTSLNDLNTSLLRSSKLDVLSALINSSIDTTEVTCINKFMSKLEEIYYNPSLRFSNECWLELLTLHILDDNNFINNLEKELIEFISNHKYIPNNIYKLLNARFNWSSRVDELKSTYPSHQIDILITELNRTEYLSYAYLNDINSNSVDEYLKLREIAFTNISNPEFKELKDILLTAYSIYNKDLDLLKLLGTYYFNKNNNIIALKYFKEAFTINNNDMFTLSKLGQLFTRCEQYLKAIIYLEKYIKRLGNTLDISSLEALAHCYNHAYELQKAYDLYKFLFRLNPWNLDFKNTLIAIKEKLGAINNINLDTSIYKRYINYYLNPFIRKLNELYSNFNLRINEDNWNDLFTLPLAKNNDLFFLMEEYLIEFLTAHENIPKCIFIFLDSKFNWLNRQNEIAEFYNHLNVNLLFNKLTLNETLSIVHLTDIDSNTIDEYLNIRNLAYKTINTNSIDCENYLEKASYLYNNDYELYKLYGQYYWNNNLYEKAISNFKCAISLKTDDYYSCCSLAVLLIKIENYKEAILYLEKSVNTPAGKLLLANDDFLTKYAVCYYYNNDLVKAKKYFKQLYKLNPNIHFIKTYLKNINDRLLGKRKEIIPIEALSNPNYSNNNILSTTKLKLNTIFNKIIIRN